VGYFERKFQLEVGVVYQRLLAPESYGVSGLSRGVVCVIVSLAILIHLRVTDRDRRTYDDGYYPRIASASRVNMINPFRI